MNRALAAGAAGMAAQQAALDTIAENLANLDAPGYRAARPEFAAMLQPDGGAIGPELHQPRVSFAQGRLEETNDPHDLAIDGEGFFRLVAADGQFGYSRAGNFTPDVAGRLRLPNGAALDGVRLPRGTTAIDVMPDGAVEARVAGKTDTVSAGRIRLYAFADTRGLHQSQDGLFSATSGAGRTFEGKPGAGGFGRLKQRCLERANISVMSAMMAVLAAQRAFEANAKTVQAADEMLRLANNLERG